MTASELKQRSEQDPMYITKLTQGRMNRPTLMRIRVKEQSNPNAMSSGDGDRLRLSVMYITQFMPIAGTSEETRVTLAQNLRVECDEIIRAIEVYG